VPLTSKPRSIGGSARHGMMKPVFTPEPTFRTFRRRRGGCGDRVRAGGGRGDRVKGAGVFGAGMHLCLFIRGMGVLRSHHQRSVNHAYPLSPNRIFDEIWTFSGRRGCSVSQINKLYLLFGLTKYYIYIGELDVKTVDNRIYVYLLELSGNFFHRRVR
jgi:hypothetical protein